MKSAFGSKSMVATLPQITNIKMKVNKEVRTAYRKISVKISVRLELTFLSVVILFAIYHPTGNPNKIQKKGTPIPTHKTSIIT